MGPDHFLGPLSVLKHRAFRPNSTQLILGGNHYSGSAVMQLSGEIILGRIEDGAREELKERKRERKRESRLHFSADYIKLYIWSHLNILHSP